MSMAERRMFSKKIVDSDAFLDMPQSTQLLYFHLSMHADDDGFVNSPKKIIRDVGCKDDDFRILVAKKFIIPFESGVVVIKHWLIHNYIQKDRYNPTTYIDEKSLLLVDDNKAYSTVKPECIQNGYKLDTQVRLGKGRLDKVSSNKVKKVFTPPTLEEIKEYALSIESSVDYDFFYKYFTSSNWVNSYGKPVVNWKQTFLTWDKKDKEKREKEQGIPFEKQRGKLRDL